MPLIPCIDCGKEISDRATTCIHCGGPVPPAPVEPGPVFRLDPDEVLYDRKGVKVSRTALTVGTKVYPLSEIERVAVGHNGDVSIGNGCLSSFMVVPLGLASVKFTFLLGLVGLFAVAAVVSFSRAGWWQLMLYRRGNYSYRSRPIYVSPDHEEVRAVVDAWERARLKQP